MLKYFIFQGFQIYDISAKMHNNIFNKKRYLNGISI